MRSTLKFLFALFIALAVMLAFRALALTIYTVPGSQLEPTFKAGDRVMVNRWSYGLRTGDNGLFAYGRLCRQTVNEGDWLAIDDSLGQTLVGCCVGQPGDTVSWQGRKLIVPGKVTCAHHDYYLLDNLGFVREEQIIGRVIMVVYNHTPGYAPWLGYDKKRFIMPL